MNKTELITAIAERTSLTKKDTEGFIKAFEETVIEELSGGGKVQLVGFGTFEVVNRAARTTHVPSTGKIVEIPASKAAKFSAGKTFKDAVKNLHD